MKRININGYDWSYYKDSAVLLKEGFKYTQEDKIKLDNAKYPIIIRDNNGSIIVFSIRDVMKLMHIFTSNMEVE